jgi:cyanophycinase
VTRCAGAIALVGSGEYLPQMEPVDRLLLAEVGGPAARVVVLPTAAGLEGPASPQRWARNGVAHFNRIAARADAVNILNRDDAFDGRWLPLLESADLIYFSGGSPRHLVDTLAGSPAWQTISERHVAGAVLAGCSAGAMAFGGMSLQPRRLWTTSTVDGSTQAPGWYPALGLVPWVVVLPHFDRWMSRMGSDTLMRLASALPPGKTLIGVDEDTALVSLDGCGVSDSPSEWRVLGRQGVSIIDAEHGEVRHASGATLVLGGRQTPASG